MKKLIMMSLTIGVIFFNPLFATLPPNYLSVDGFKDCLGTKSMGTWQSYCLPNKKPQNCLETSWNQLITMDIPSCD
ncbi:hypothetical protein L3V82_03720 [Thiotrichales bacterium 19S3-7]|nr:hypothetical protein [Thiotrichales bacterium 19S3-7]MCF6801245.1 hypothetical protein [Thiotrichales bacterium 19S3-11]